jgi:hypothetical protein
MIPFQRYITRPKIIKIVVTKQKRNICNHLTTAYQGGQKNHNKENDYGSSSHSSLLVLYDQILVGALQVAMLIHDSGRDTLS